MVEHVGVGNELGEDRARETDERGFEDGIWGRVQEDEEVEVGVRVVGVVDSGLADGPGGCGGAAVAFSVAS